LKKYGSYKIIIAVHSGSSVADLDDSFYDQLVTFRNKSHIKRLVVNAKKLKLIYGFTSKPSYVRAAIESVSTKTLFDPYDCLIVYYGKYPKQRWMREEIVDEEFCFNNAKGVIARNLESKKSLEAYSIVNKKNIFFTDYCDGDYFINPERRNTSTISITYSGGIYGRHMLKSSHGIENFFDFIDSMNEQSIDVHIYPSPHTKPEVYADYVEEAKRLKHLFLHKTVLQKNLSKEISKYYFGVSPHFKEESSAVSKDKLELGTSLKFFNFLEAGIPVLMSAEMKFMAWLVERYNIGIVFTKEDIPNLAEIIGKCDYEALQQNVIKVRERLSMKKNISRLIRFIDEIE
jgi:hypothetical protein